MQQPTGHKPRSSCIRAHPPAELAGTRTAGESWQPSNSPAAGPPPAARHSVGCSQLETLSGFETQQSSSGTGQSGGSVPEGYYGPTGSAALRGWSFLPLQDQPQYPFPVLGGCFKGDSSTSPDKPSHGAHKAIERGQRINSRRGMRKGAPRRKATPPTLHHPAAAF